MVVLLMATMAGLGLVYALRTAPARQKRHADLKSIFEVRQHRPADLPALGYLPFDTRIAAGIHVEDIRQSELGKKLLDGSRWPIANLALERIRLWTDLPADAVDHIAIGVSIPQDELPGLVLAVQTRRPYRESLRNKFGSLSAEKLYERPLFRFDLQPVGKGCLWCADDRTFVIMLRLDGVQRAHLDRLPIKAIPELNQFSDILQRLVKQRLPQQPAAWAVGDLGGLSDTADLIKLTPLGSKLSDVLGNVQTFAIAAQVQKDVVVNAAIEGTDARAAYVVEAYLANIDKNAVQSLKLFGLPPASVLAARCVSQGTTPGCDFLAIPTMLSRSWVIAQIRGDIDSLKQLTWK